MIYNLPYVFSSVRNTLTTMPPKRKSSPIWQYFSERLEPADYEDENSEEETFKNLLQLTKKGQLFIL